MSFLILFGVGVLCRILYCLVHCLLFTCKLLHIYHLGWEREGLFFLLLITCSFAVSIREASTHVGVIFETCTGFRSAYYGWLRNEVSQALVPVTVLKLVALAPYDVLN